MADENKIDLYADTEDLKLLSAKLEQPDPDDVEPDPETDALYDSVVTTRINGDGNDDRFNQKYGDVNSKAGCDECLVTEVSSSSEIASKITKFSVLVGNLTWFTTDVDIENCLKDIGVEDVTDIKFVDNRTNGQSKGYCSVHVGSERSIRLIHERLPKKELYEKRIMVATPSKCATAQFEAQSDCKGRAQQPNTGATGNNSRSSMLPPLGVSIPPQPFGIPPPPGPRLVGPPPRINRNMLGSEVNSPPSVRILNLGHQRGGPPPMPPHHMNFGPHLSRPHGLPFHPHNPRPHYRPYHQPGHPPCSFPLPPSPNDHRGSHPPRHEWMHNTGGPHVPPNNQLPPHCPSGPMGHPPPLDMGLDGSSGISLIEPPPAPHVNPAFFQSQYSPPMPIIHSPEVPPTKIPRSRDNPHKLELTTYASPSQSAEDVKPSHINRFPSLNDSEVGEIVSRNRTVSSSAISRAVTDAAKGDFASAIETLVTAISLIKQSRVGNDERCKILITSLQDTLHGIETKSYSRVRVVHMRSKSRSRSRERNCMRYRSRHHHYRSRSRSRGRSRSREHYHRERGRSRSISSSRGQEFERNSKYDDHDRYRELDRERHNRDRDTVNKNSRGSGGSTRTHDENERIDHKPSRR